LQRKKERERERGELRLHSQRASIGIRRALATMFVQCMTVIYAVCTVECYIAKVSNKVCITGYKGPVNARQCKCALSDLSCPTVSGTTVRQSDGTIKSTSPGIALQMEEERKKKRRGKNVAVCFKSRVCKSFPKQKCTGLQMSEAHACKHA
jgi:hypothetical protein